MNNSYTVGILGGMGSYATLDYFKRLLDAIPAEKEWERPRIIIDNRCTMPSRVRAILYNEKKEELIDNMQESVESLMNYKVNRIVMICNTAHYFYDTLNQRVPGFDKKCIHIIKECANVLHEKNVHEVGLLASEGTIQTSIYENELTKNEIRIKNPNENQLCKIRELIEAVKTNSINEDTINEFEKLIQSYDMENIVLGCTEMPILARKLEYNKVNLFDPLDVSIECIKKDFYRG